MTGLMIRDAVAGDLPAIAAIYGHHVRQGLASFEEEAPTVAEMAHRHAELVGRGYPYLVAEIDGAVTGYAYAGPYRTRPSYRHSVENSVYLAPDRQRTGIGSRLLEELIHRCEAAGFRQMVAIIGDSANAASIGLHARMGFRHAGVLTAIGYKHGRWVDSVLMQRPLGPGDTRDPA